MSHQPHQPHQLHQRTFRVYGSRKRPAAAASQDLRALWPTMPRLRRLSAWRPL